MSVRLTLAALAVTIACAANAQDFASRYMAEHAADSTLTCISVSPKMMEEILSKGIQHDDSSRMVGIISKLKSMQIVSSENNGMNHFELAENMAEKNSARFKQMAAYDEGKDRCRIFIREQKKRIVELVLLRQTGKSFTVINFTGNMNREFIEKLENTMIPEQNKEKDKKEY